MTGYEEIAKANQEAFQREFNLAGSLTDTPPSNVVEQDRRSKNRFREHSGEGCELTKMWHQSRRQPNHFLYKCSCGWVGWLIPPKENV